MEIHIAKSKLKGIYQPPSSKSITHRALIASAFCDGKSILRNIDYSDDINATISCLETLGIKFEKSTTINENVITKHNFIIVNGAGRNFEVRYDKNGYAVFNCNESATTLRFFIAVAIALGIKSKFIVSGRLIDRPIDVYKKICDSEKGIFKVENGSIYVDCKLSKDSYTVSGDVSSQFISGMLFAMVLSKKTFKLITLPPVESKPYIDMTISVLRDFGFNIAENISVNDSPICYNIVGESNGKAIEYVIESDYSNASNFEAMNFYSSINICELSVFGNNALSQHMDELSVTKNSVLQHRTGELCGPTKIIQGDIRYKEFFEAIKNNNHPILDVRDNLDLVPILCVYSAFYNGVKLVGTRRLKYKESNRALSIKEELCKCGVNVILDDDSMDVKKSELHAPTAIINSHNDHRIVMAVTVLGLYLGDMEIDGAEAVKKSYPNFFDDIIKLGGNISFK